MKIHFKQPIAILALSALAACSYGASGVPIANGSPHPIVTPATGVPLVGVGDSLTAGYQSSGFLGVASQSSASAYPNGAVYPGQDNGFWADLFDCDTSTGATCSHTPFGTTNASLAVLPLIAAPGLADQLVLNATTLLASVQSSCSAFNLQAYSSTGWAATRVDPKAQTLDLGVPGITMHEALTMTGPLTGPPPGAPTSCGYPTNPHDPTAGGLQSLVAGESALFYPVMGGYRGNFGYGALTEVNVAAALKPKLATVWLGANDLLKYIFSDAQSPVTDTPTQMASDLTTIVKKLTASGSKVLVADLPTVLTTPQFFPVGSSTNPNKLTDDFAVLLVANGVPVAAAPTYAAGITSYLSATYFSNATTGWYLTETGFLTTVQEAAQAIEANPLAPNFTTINLNAAGLGLGEAYITPAFATEINALNAAYNTAIDTVAKSAPGTVALVPVNTVFQSIATNGLPLGPGETVTLQFGGGLVGWDGLHPSNLGYAVIANAFIQSADTPAASGGLGLTIPPLSNTQIGAIAESDPYDPFVIKAINPNSPFPLP